MTHTFFGMDDAIQKKILTVALIVYVLLMIVGAIIPNPQDVPVFSGNTKYFHFLGFILLAVMVLKTFELYGFKHKYLLSAILLTAFVVLTEILQLFVSTRHFLYTDMLIDGTGCIIGYIIYWGLNKWIFSKR